MMGQSHESDARAEAACPHRSGWNVIVDKVYLRDPDGIEFALGAVGGLRLLRDAGFALFLITDQSGIARRLFRRYDA
jgi:hypothetical protein